AQLPAGPGVPQLDRPLLVRTGEPFAVGVEGRARDLPPAVREAVNLLAGLQVPDAGRVPDRGQALAVRAEGQPEEVVPHLKGQRADLPGFGVPDPRLSTHARGEEATVGAVDQREVVPHDRPRSGGALQAAGDPPAG